MTLPTNIITNKDPRWYSLKQLSIKLNIAIGKNDYYEANETALNINKLQTEMGLEVKDFLPILEKIK